MLNMEKLRAARARKESERIEGAQPKAYGWRLVPVGYLVESLEERAAVLQFDAGLTRESAERSALAEGDQCFRVYELILEG